MLPLGSTIGIVGGGQLGRMLSLAAAHMGYHTHIYTPNNESPASYVSTHTTVANYDDTQALEAFAKACDVITFEFENVPSESMAYLERHSAVYPSPGILETCRHRHREKQAVQQFGARTATYHYVGSVEDLHALEGVEYPCVLKSCELGYDGKGQVKASNLDELVAGWRELNTTEAVIEHWVDFECEISVIVCRDAKGSALCYPASRNIHENHILARTIAPAQNISEETAQKAQTIARNIAEGLGLVGIMAVELFVLKNGDVIVNELAPRPHNSGHHTIEAAATGQFEQLIRIITGQELGSTDLLCSAEMINLVGDSTALIEKHSKDPHAHLHWYGKKEVREARKMGHITVLKP